LFNNNNNNNNRNDDNNIDPEIRQNSRGTFRLVHYPRQRARGGNSVHGRR
jgi:hypothetical protein